MIIPETDRNVGLAFRRSKRNGITLDYNFERLSPLMSLQIISSAIHRDAGRWISLVGVVLNSATPLLFFCSSPGGSNRSAVHHRSRHVKLIQFKTEAKQLKSETGPCYWKKEKRRTAVLPVDPIQRQAFNPVLSLYNRSSILLIVASKALQFVLCSPLPRFSMIVHDQWSDGWIRLLKEQSANISAISKAMPHSVHP
jgi:hypothetical protein